jgi:hypothetical protein
MDYSNTAHKLSAARRDLLPPHSRGLAYSIALAFHNAFWALHGVNPDLLDETPREWITELQGFLDTSDFQHLEDDRFRAKAEQMSEDEVFAFSRLIDDLANWFLRAAIEQD